MLYIIGIIIFILVIGLIHISYVYSEYKSLMYDSLTIDKGTQVGIFNDIRKLYKENSYIFTVNNKDVYTLQTHWLYAEHDCYFNPYYIVVNGFNIYLHKYEYIKYWFWIKYITKKHKRGQNDKNRSIKNSGTYRKDVR